MGYDFIEFLRLARNLLITKLFYYRKNKKPRLIRQPSYIRGYKYVQIGKGFTTGVGLRLDALKLTKNIPTIKIGNNVSLNDNVHIGCVNKVTIGDNVLIASKVYISDHNHGYYDESHLSLHESPNSCPKDRLLTENMEVVIKNNVWIGEFVSILPGVVIGEGAIIGTMSVVTKDIPPYCIAVGSPARVIKKYCFETNIWEKV